ncbi:transcription elongation factor SPT6 [Microplitis demolitor]|uniref:transcription elongation factor SPT6 n=1 Tax=Microplitis demolitor TaxID=69319 RepID=UPI0004CCD204|nr:transcription elongation factor SPT6 [Microplitis demolitor]
MRTKVKAGGKKNQMETENKNNVKFSKKRKISKILESSDDENPEDKKKVRKRKKNEALKDNSNKRKIHDDFDDRLDDDDYDLIEENIGVKLKRKSFKRVRKLSDSESDDDEVQSKGDVKSAIADELFGKDSDDEDENKNIKKPLESQDRRKTEIQVCDKEDSGSDGESSGVDDFIIDDIGLSSNTDRGQKKLCSNAAYQEAQEIFGFDFDYSEFKQNSEDSDEDEGYDEERSPVKYHRKKKTVRSIFDIYEPSELKRLHFTDKDEEIRCKDIPERMQLRSIPVTPVSNDSFELDQEALWIYQQAFCRSTILRKTFELDINENIDGVGKKSPETVEKIKNALDFIRNKNFDVPFIAFYRKEYVLPELDIKDLWKVYEFDEKWCQLNQRKESLLRLFKNMKDYLLDKVKNSRDNIRVIDDKYIEQLANVQTDEELNDFHHHLMLYYNRDIPAMQEAVRQKEKEAKRREKMKNRLTGRGAGEYGDDLSSDESDQEVKTKPTRKKAVRNGSYALFKKFGLDNLIKKFGLSPLEFAENLQENYQHHRIDQVLIEPNEVAQDYVGKSLKTTEEVLKAAQAMMALELSREPILRKCVRAIYMERAKLTVRPTKKGIKVIDENHEMYTMQYLKEKPVRELVGDQWLKLVTAVKDKLITIHLSDIVEGNTTDNYIDEMKLLFVKNNNSDVVHEWNKLRTNSVEDALIHLVIPDLKKELNCKLLAEAKSFVMEACCKKLHDWINVAPISCEFPGKEDEVWNTSDGIRVMGISYVPDYSQAAFACIIAPNGECKDILKLPYLLKRRNDSNNNNFGSAAKEAELKTLRDFINKNKPHVVVIGGESREALQVSEEITECIDTLSEEVDYPSIRVEISDTNVAKIYANTKGVTEFCNYPPQLREAISLARRIQNPLGEFSQLCNSDEDLLCLKFHPYQDSLSKEELVNNLYTEFINIVNSVGVDINEPRTYTENLLQFVSGLGARKSHALLKIIKNTNQKLASREQLVTVCHMGPKIFINCAGFIKIDTDSLRYNSDTYIQILDSTRIHPETYKLAAKMAIDALEYDDDNEDKDAALEEILKSPQKLTDLDLDAFAKELERRGFGKKINTLYDIQAEMNCQYKDPRTPYESPNAEQLFDLLTKETPQTLYIGKLVSATVIGMIYRKKADDQSDNQLVPVKNDETGLWKCPHCLKDDFADSSNVLEHFDTDNCSTVSSIKLRLENGLHGFISVKNLSDNYINDPEKMIAIGNSFQCRVIFIHTERFLIECSLKKSDLLDLNNELRPTKDPFYDTETEQLDKKIEEEKKKAKQQVLLKRVIYHPSFRNVSFAEAERMMKTMKQGEAIIRPCSRGLGYLSATWKVTDDIYQHIAIKETGNYSYFSLGKSLWIDDEEFEDLDEIIARHINPMALYAAELLDFKYFVPGIDGLEAKAEEYLKIQKQKNSNKVPYIISAMKIYPGKFLLSYFSNNQFHHLHITVTPDGLSFQKIYFQRLYDLIKWFKNELQKCTNNNNNNNNNNKIRYLISADDFGSVIDYQSHPKLAIPSFRTLYN